MDVDPLVGSFTVHLLQGKFLCVGFCQTELPTMDGVPWHSITLFPFIENLVRFLGTFICRELQVYYIPCILTSVIGNNPKGTVSPKIVFEIGVRMLQE